MLLRWIGYGLLRPLFMHCRHRNHWSTWSDVLLFSFFFENIKKKKKWLQICASRRFGRLQSALISIDVSPSSPCWIYSRGNIEKNERAVGIRVHRVNHANLITLHTCLYYLFYLFREKFFAKHDPPFQQLRAISRAIIILPFRLVTGYICIRLFNIFWKVESEKEEGAKSVWARTFVHVETIKYTR